VWKSAAGRFAAAAAHWAARWVGPYPVLVVTLLLGLVAAVALTAASVEIHEAVAEADGVASLDRPVLRWAVSVRTPQLNTIVNAFTDVGGPVGMPILAAVATIALAIRRRAWTPVVLMVAATGGSLLMTVVGKLLVGRLRPPLVDAVAPYETSASFPSGRSLNAVVVAGVVAYLLLLRQGRWAARVSIVGGAALFAVLMGLSRVYLSHHWLTDVLVAWTLGLAWLSIIVVAHRLYLTVRHVHPSAATTATSGQGTEDRLNDNDNDPGPGNAAGRVGRINGCCNTSSAAATCATGS
jgi:membrane-associated phospholipid phosphatase